MKKFLVIILTFILSISLLPKDIEAAQSLPTLSTVRSLLNQGVPNGFAAKLGTQMVDHKVQLVKARYRFAKQGGASVVGPTTLLGNLLDEDNGSIVLPSKAVVKQVLIDVVDPVQVAAIPFNLVQFSIGLNNSTDLLAPVTASTLSGLNAGIPIGTAATMVKQTGTSALTLHSTGGSVTRGDWNVFVEYYLSD